jgi:hypothetical protein
MTRTIAILLVLALSGCKCVESRDGYCPPDRSVVIEEPIGNAAAAGI